MTMNRAVAAGVVTVLAAFGTLATTAIPASAAHASASQPPSVIAPAKTLPGSIFAGYWLKKSGVTSATTAFTVPALKCSKATSGFVDENLEVGKSSTDGTPEQGAVVSFIGACGAKGAEYIALVIFPPQTKGKYLTGIASGDKITIKITDTASSSSVTVSVKGHAHKFTGPGFVATATLVGVVVEPAAASGPKWSDVKFSDSKVDGKSLGSYPLVKVDATTPKGKVLAEPTRLKVGGTEFVVNYAA
ncbi:MAG: hypothetical protein WAL04_08800 [Acidimicrobiales bacterium]|jgi:hypothetical protein